MSTTELTYYILGMIFSAVITVPMSFYYMDKALNNQRKHLMKTVWTGRFHCLEVLQEASKNGILRDEYDNYQNFIEDQLSIDTDHICTDIKSLTKDHRIQTSDT